MYREESLDDYVRIRAWVRGCEYVRKICVCLVLDVCVCAHVFACGVRTFVCLSPCWRETYTHLAKCVYVSVCVCVKECM